MTRRDDSPRDGAAAARAWRDRLDAEKADSGTPDATLGDAIRGALDGRRMTIDADDDGHLTVHRPGAPQRPGRIGWRDGKVTVIHDDE